MKRLKRRQFGKLAAASLTSTIFIDASSKAVAQRILPSQPNIFGIKIASTSPARDKENQTPAVELSVANLGLRKVLSKINVAVNSVENPLAVAKQSRAFFVAHPDRVTKLAAMKDGNLVASTVAHTRNGCFNHLLFTVGGANNPIFRAKKILGLERANQTVESLLSLPNNQLLCLVGTDGTPPFTFRTIDFRTGKIISRDDLNLPPLPNNHRFANLCQDAKGNIFATEITSEGIPILISMNFQDRAIVTGKVKINRLNPLTLNGRPLFNDVRDLVFSPSGQLHALVPVDGGKNNALCVVDVNTGKMERLDNLDAEKFAYSA
jgi:hypothetical protein